MKLKAWQLACWIVLTNVGGLSYRAKAQAPAAPAAPLPPALLRECAARVAKDLPKVQIVGKFVFAKKKVASTTDVLLGQAGDVFAIAASKHSNLFGSTLRGFAGCSYTPRNGKWEFSRFMMTPPLPRRVKLMPGED